MFRWLLIIILILVLGACRPHIFSPKPAGYYKLDTPANHTYRTFDQPGFPYTFEYPTYSHIDRDTMFFEEKAENPYWIDVVFPEFNATIYITYKEINANQTYAKLDEDAWKMSFFHHEKADYIHSDVAINPAGVSEILYIVGGDAASKYQFTATDSIHHFLRGALYINVTPNADSLKPVTDFLERDIEHLLWTIKWK